MTDEGEPEEFGERFASFDNTQFVEEFTQFASFENDRSEGKILGMRKNVEIIGRQGSAAEIRKFLFSFATPREFSFWSFARYTVEKLMRVYFFPILFFRFSTPPAPGSSSSTNASWKNSKKSCGEKVLSWRSRSRVSLSWSRIGRICCPQ